MEKKGRNVFHHFGKQTYTENWKRDRLPSISSREPTSKSYGAYRKESARRKLREEEEEEDGKKVKYYIYSTPKNTVYGREFCHKSVDIVRKTRGSNPKEENLKKKKNSFTKEEKKGLFKTSYSGDHRKFEELKKKEDFAKLRGRNRLTKDPSRWSENRVTFVGDRKMKTRYTEDYFPGKDFDMQLNPDAIFSTKKLNKGTAKYRGIKSGYMGSVPTSSKVKMNNKEREKKNMSWFTKNSGSFIPGYSGFKPKSFANYSSKEYSIDDRHTTSSDFVRHEVKRDPSEKNHGIKNLTLKEFFTLKDSGNSSSDGIALAHGFYKKSSVF